MNGHAISSSYHTPGARRSAARTGARRRARHHRGHGAAVVVRLVLITLLLATAASVVTSLTVRSATPAATVWGSVTVQPALTLWDLASAHPVEGLSVPATVALIKAENHLSSALIYPGQTLLVPLEATGSDLVAAR